MCFDFDGYCEWYECRTVIGRKEHRCNGCRKTIMKGEKHRVHTGKFEGEFFSERECASCRRAILSIAAMEIEHGCSWATAWCPLSDLEEYLAEAAVPVKMLDFATLEECETHVENLHKQRITNL